MPFIHSKDFITFLCSHNVRVKEDINKSSVHIATPPFFKISVGENFGIALEHHRHFINIPNYLKCLVTLTLATKNFGEIEKPHRYTEVIQMI